MPTRGSNTRPDLPLAVIIGAGGLGMAVARRLGQEYRLLLADRDGDHAAAQAAQLDAQGFDAGAMACDVTDAAAVSALARTCGPVAALAYVVGLSPSCGDAAAILRVNLQGAARVMQAFQPVMAKGGCGLFVSSSSAHMSPVEADLWPLLDDPLTPDMVDAVAQILGDTFTPAGTYARSKAALNRLCQKNAAAWGADGLRIVSISPGLIATPMGAKEYAASPGKMRLLEKVPLGREVTMPEVAEVIAFLLSARASYISGTDILVDGGLCAALICNPEDANASGIDSAQAPRGL